MADLYTKEHINQEIMQGHFTFFWRSLDKPYLYAY